MYLYQVEGVLFPSASHCQIIELVLDETGTWSSISLGYREGCRTSFTVLCKGKIRVSTGGQAICLVLFFWIRPRSSLVYIGELISAVVRGKVTTDLV